MLILTLILPMLMAATFLLLLRHWRRQQLLHEELSPISRQHIDIYQGVQLSESAVESAKARFRELLERGEVDAVESSLRAGMQYVVQVRALAEIGTDDAGRILERQLQRRLTEDVVEQAWYWIDLANGLRTLNRAQSLPHLLRCAESAAELPLGHFFAAETICFLGFAGYLRQAETSLGRAALRVLHRALEGLRFGVQPTLVAEARVGEMIESLWDSRDKDVDPLAVRVYVEALRMLRRAPHAETVLAGEASEQEAFSWQMSRLAALEPALAEYLAEAPAALRLRLPDAPPKEQREILLALIDLRSETAPVVLPLLARPRFAQAELALESLVHSSDPRVGPALLDFALQRVAVGRRSRRRRSTVPPPRPSVALDFPYRSLLRALRACPGKPVEDFLLTAARDWDPTYRAAALSSLGWWEPVQRRMVLATLQDARHDANLDVRQAARAALARLGERQALQWFRQTLASEDPHRMHEAIQAVAVEGVTLLWPDLDHLADAEDADVAQVAREALERMCEEMDFGRRERK
ncbi:MAG TPA: HEAT repeat domain-containing protein [Gemmataceae bacterium]|nr:HEAT repeat domain-containing protein [Gemmataceae bacterium]